MRYFNVNFYLVLNTFVHIKAYYGYHTIMVIDPKKIVVAENQPETYHQSETYHQKGLSG